jgi:hypothetical protein
MDESLTADAQGLLEELESRDDVSRVEFRGDVPNCVVVTLGQDPHGVSTERKATASSWDDALRLLLVRHRFEMGY